MDDRPLILGAGAVGCYLGGRLQDGGVDVALAGRERVVAAIERHGLIVREGDAQQVTHPAAAVTPDLFVPADLLLLTVRAFDVAATLPAVVQSLSPSGRVVAFQNGVGTEESVAAAVGRERTIVATLTVSAGMEEPGVVTRYSTRGGIALASMTDAPVPDRLVSIVAATGLPTVTVPDYRSLRWSKLLLNMLGAATSAILDVPMVDIVRNPDLFRLEQLALREAGRVMDAAGIRTVSLPGYPVPLVRRVMRLPRPLAHRILAPRIAGARGGRAPGARGDMARSRSEIPWMNGAVAEEGRKLDVRTPVNDVLADLTAYLVAHPEERPRYRERPDRLVETVRERGIRL